MLITKKKKSYFLRIFKVELVLKFFLKSHSQLNPCSFYNYRFRYNPKKATHRVTKLAENHGTSHYAYLKPVLKTLLTFMFIVI